MAGRVRGREEGDRGRSEEDRRSSKRNIEEFGETKAKQRKIDSLMKDSESGPKRKKERVCVCVFVYICMYVCMYKFMSMGMYV